MSGRRILVGNLDRALMQILPLFFLQWRNASTFRFGLLLAIQPLRRFGWRRKERHHDRM